jgi:hypothetical protein
MQKAPAVKRGLLTLKFYKKLGIESKKALTIRSEPSSFEFLDNNRIKKNYTTKIVFTKCWVFVKEFSIKRVPHVIFHSSN